MAASLARRSTHLRNLWRPTRRTPISCPTSPPIQPNFTFQQTRISPIRSPSRFRRELSSLLPVHSAIASACLVSKLPSIADGTNEVSIKNLSFKRFRSAIENAKRDLIETLRENVVLEVCHI
ncbi:hypothetical protein GIB67_035249 [Kingdonia uniflora]|uniref:Uncharacterized protein n=1 Tax=Kingdonia uniflora TaxID=39325 RepID=A0A7J7KXW4_9MAGN|nr:hypothetical protein GIB67_035249 [Kingdonia uniflora]